MSHRKKSGFKIISNQKAFMDSEKSRFETVFKNADASYKLFINELKTQRTKNQDKINILESLMREDLIDKIEQLDIFNDELKKDKEHVDSQIEILEEKRSKSIKYFKNLVEDFYTNLQSFTQADTRRYSDNIEELRVMQQEIENKIMLLASLQDNFIKEKRKMAKIISDVTDLINQETAAKEAAKVKVSAAAASDLILEEEKEALDAAAARRSIEIASAEAARRLAESSSRSRQKSDNTRLAASAAASSTDHLDLSALGRSKLSSPDDISLFQVDPSTARFELFAPDKVGSSNIVRLSDAINNKATRKQFSAQISGMLQNELHGSKVKLFQCSSIEELDKQLVICGDVDDHRLFHITFHGKTDKREDQFPTEVININLDDATKNNNKKLVLKLSFFIHQDLNGTKTFFFKQRWIVKEPVFNEAGEITGYIIDPNQDISSQDPTAVQMLINTSEFIKIMFIEIFPDKLEPDQKGGRRIHIKRFTKGRKNMIVKRKTKKTRRKKYKTRRNKLTK